MSSILIVEDDPTLQELYIRMFEDLNFTVRSASDGEEAIAIAKKVHPHVMLLDLMIPKISGFDVLRNIKTDEITRNIKVVILTNLYADKEELYKDGADSVLIKAENTPDQIIEKVRALLQTTE